MQPELEDNPMCGRMTLTRSGAEIAAYFEEASESEPDSGPLFADSGDGTLALKPRFNIAPTQEILTIALDEAGHRRGEWRRWGLVPSWAKDPSIGNRLFNARSETAATKPSFRSAVRKRRCVVPADGFYEWTPRNRGHDPYLFRRGDGEMLALAGLYERWLGVGGEVIDSCTILTADANGDLDSIHHRMPVILAREALAAWLDPTSEAETIDAMMGPAPDGTLSKQRVSRAVNNARNDSPDCIEAAPDSEQPGLFQLDGGTHGKG